LGIRKNVRNLNTSEKNNFVNAVITLKSTPSILHPSDTTKSRYDDYAEIHHHAMMAMSMTDPSVDPNWYPGWAHNGPAFFPWHRQLLFQFEKDLQAIDTTVTIPYWDWTDSASSPFTLDFLGPDGDTTDPNDPLKVNQGPFSFDGPNNWTITVKDNNSDPDYLQRGFGRRLDAQNLPTTSQVQNALSPLQYETPPWKLASAGFRMRVEYNLHNLVHRWVNGTMMLMTSPNDPVFWLHHANIDRLWGNWQRQHPEVCPYLPTFGAMIGHSLYDQMIFSAMPPSPWPGSSSPASVLDHYTMGYVYDSDPPRITPVAPAISVRIPQAEHILPLFPLMKEVRLLTKRRSLTKRRQKNSRSRLRKRRKR
jgi:tyrosinase